MLGNEGLTYGRGTRCLAVERLYGYPSWKKRLCGDDVPENTHTLSGGEYKRNETEEQTR